MPDEPVNRLAWRTCDRADWMIRALTRNLPNNPRAPSRRKLSLCLADLARRTLRYCGEHKATIEAALDATAEWAHGNGTIGNLQAILKATKAIRDRALGAVLDAEGTYEFTVLDAYCCALDAADCVLESALHGKRNTALCAGCVVEKVMWNAARINNTQWQNTLRDELQAQALIIREHYPDPPGPAVRYIWRKTVTSQKATP